MSKIHKVNMQTEVEFIIEQLENKEYLRVLKYIQVRDEFTVRELTSSIIGKNLGLNYNIDKCFSELIKWSNKEPIASELSIELKNENGQSNLFINNKCIKSYNDESSFSDSEIKILSVILNKEIKSSEDLHQYLIMYYSYDNGIDVEDMTNDEFGQYIVEVMRGFSISKGKVVTKAALPVYNCKNDNINMCKWHNSVFTNKYDFCSFDNNAFNKTTSKGHRTSFIKLIKDFQTYVDSYEWKG